MMNSLKVLIIYTHTPPFNAAFPFGKAESAIDSIS